MKGAANGILLAASSGLNSLSPIAKSLVGTFDATTAECSEVTVTNITKIQC
jgi:hypothetical protein